MGSIRRITARAGRLRAGALASVATGAALCLGVTGCQSTEGKRMMHESATVDSVRDRATAMTVGTDSVPAAGAGAQAAGSVTVYEAPSKLPALERYLVEMRSDPARFAKQSVNGGYKNLLADALSAMEYDLRRVGSASAVDIVRFRDSLKVEVGGGTGPTESIEPRDVPNQVRLIEQMIATYRRGMPPGTVPDSLLDPPGGASTGNR